MEAADMREELLEILTDCCPDVDFEHETALIDDGLLESLDIVTIVTDLTHRFGVEINVDDLLPENFNSVDAILELIRSKLS
jgi:acyl carrier protein